MSDYIVIARKFRPQFFKEVVGQDQIVITLKNAIKFNRVAQAYLFCGSRGTGKTTLARIFAKALNCQQPNADFEPCDQCSSCREIRSGSSLDILEIDGASNRGIDDIRQINENAGYVASAGGYKIYIIDEVHMLTKEAFNALLKTLEEPPPKVKFFFATTEPHKIPPTILSRCQRFNLNRISSEKITTKLKMIAGRLGVEADEEALSILAEQAEGGMRDAESLFDQILAFEEGPITVSSVNAILGLVSKDMYFELDQAGKEGNIAKAFEIAHQVFSQGKNLMYFVEGLIEHYRAIMLIKISGKEPSLLTLSSVQKEKYEAAACLYTQEQCLSLMDYLIDAQNKLKFASSQRIALEMILLHILRSHFRLPIETLVRRLSDLEQSIASIGNSSIADAPVSIPEPKAVSMPAPMSIPAPIIAKIVEKEVSSPKSVPVQEEQISVKMPAALPFTIASIPFTPDTYVSSISEDPTPSLADLGKKAVVTPPKRVETKKVEKQEPPIASAAKMTNSAHIKLEKPMHFYDTLFHFAAVELEGKIQKN